MSSRVEYEKRLAYLQRIVELGRGSICSCLLNASLIIVHYKSAINFN